MGFSGREFWDASVVLSKAAHALHQPEMILSPYEGNPLQLTIFVYCFNHEASIIETLGTIAEALRVTESTYEVIIIDDGSHDRSIELICEYIDANPTLSIVLCSNRHHKGLAQNYVDAAFIGRGQYYRLVRGDTHESLEAMVDIFRTVGEADIVIPHYVASMADHSRQPTRTVFYTRFMNLISGLRLSSYGGACIHLRYNVLRWHPSTSGAGFEVNLLCRLLDLGFTCKQVHCRSIGWRNSAGRMSDALSQFHMLLDIWFSRLSQRVYRR